ncbi:MAG: four helix bundle protein [Marinilabiliaceae bacterium]|nr:four helix bundle protein [Marinilabiliaceae bacterium]
MVVDIYQILEAFPKYEMFGLSSQIRRAAYSIPMNIAEGAGRKTNLDFANFLNVALGSANELDYQMLLAKDLHYIDENKYNDLELRIGEIKGMLITLISAVRRNVK